MIRRCCFSCCSLDVSRFFDGDNKLLAESTLERPAVDFMPIELREQLEASAQVVDSHFAFRIILPHSTVFAATSPFANQKLKVAWAQGFERQVYVGLSIVTLYILDTKMIKHVETIRNHDSFLNRR